MKKLMLCLLCATTPICWGMKKTTELSKEDAIVALYAANRFCRVGEGESVPKGATFCRAPDSILKKNYIPVLAKIYNEKVEFFKTEWVLDIRQELLECLQISSPQDNKWIGKQEFTKFREQHNL